MTCGYEYLLWDPPPFMCEAIVYQSPGDLLVSTESEHQQLKHQEKLLFLPRYDVILEKQTSVHCRMEPRPPA